MTDEAQVFQLTPSVRVVGSSSSGSRALAAPFYWRAWPRLATAMDFPEDKVIPFKRPVGLQRQGDTPGAPHPPPELHATAQLLKAAGNPFRLKILYLLGHTTELNVTELAHALQVTIATASRHIGVLRTHRLLTPRHEGVAVYYSLTENPFNRVLRTSLFTVADDDRRGRPE